MSAVDVVDAVDDVCSNTLVTGTVSTRFKPALDVFVLDEYPSASATQDSDLVVAGNLPDNATL